MRPFIQRPSLKQHQVHRHLAILVVAVAFCAMPFLGQPFHMDDNFYMDMARHARIEPLFPNDTPYVFEKYSVPEMGSHSHPPFVTYCLAMMQHFFGEGPGTEWKYHLCALAFPLLGILSFYFVAARFLERPLWPSIVLACSPLFLVMQHTLMTDIPTFAFWLAAIAFFIWATDTGSARLYAASALFQFAAMFTSYQSAALIPLLAAYQLKKKADYRGWLSLIPAPALMGAWFVMNYFHYHRWLLGDTARWVEAHPSETLSGLWVRLLALLQYQGWLILFPFFLLWVFGRGLRGRLLVLTTFLAVCIAQLSVPDYRLIDKAIFVVGLVTGVFVMARMSAFSLASLWDGGSALGIPPAEARFLGLWYFGVAGYCLLIFPEGSARYILPLMPPVLICFFRQLEVGEVMEYRLPARPLFSSAMLASGSLVLTLAWGLALSEADLAFARIYPRAAAEFASITHGLPAYFAGEWGFRYYFGRAGAKQLPPDESLVHGGSFLAKPKLALPYDIPKDLLSMTMPLQTLSYQPSTPLRILDLQSHAGFYSTYWGLIPFSLSRRTLEEVEIRQVNFLVERLPWSRIECISKTKPWPGYLEIEGTSPLAVLAKPGTKIAYPWTESDPVTLDLSIGVGANGYKQGSAVPFVFTILQLDSQGGILTRFSRTLVPGTSKQDRSWLPVRLALKGRREGAEFLEIEFQSGNTSAAATGAFAEAFLRCSQ